MAFHFLQANLPCNRHESDFTAGIWIPPSAAPLVVLYPNSPGGHGGSGLLDPQSRSLQCIL